MSFHDLDTPDTFEKGGESVELGCPCADCCNGVSPRKNTITLDDFYVRSLHAQYWGHAPPSKMAEVADGVMEPGPVEFVKILKFVLPFVGTHPVVVWRNHYEYR